MLDGIGIKLDDLTEWERDFYDSVNEQFAKRQNLSDKQYEILERIYDKVS